jgi:hypothetical protein
MRILLLSIVLSFGISARAEEPKQNEGSPHGDVYAFHAKLRGILRDSRIRTGQSVVSATETSCSVLHVELEALRARILTSSDFVGAAVRRRITEAEQGLELICNSAAPAASK